MYNPLQMNELQLMLKWSEKRNFLIVTHNVKSTDLLRNGTVYTSI